MYELGVFLRQRYPDFIKTEYDPKESTFISSDKDRTINSASLVAQGLYKNYNQDAKWNGKSPVQFQPVPVRMIPKEIDRYIQLSYKCPTHQRLFEKVIATEYAPGFYAEMEEFMKVFAKERNIYDPLNTTLNDIDRLHHIIMFEEQPHYNATHNLPVEEWAQEYLTNDILIALKTGYLKFNVKTREMQRLYTGSMLGLILNSFSNPEATKITAYAGHDRIVYALLVTLGVWDFDEKDMPPVASALILELYGEEEDHQYLKLWYRKGTSSTPKRLEIPTCGPECSFSTFLKLFKDLVPEDFEAECGLLS